jgi:hypothetical protein
MVRTCVYTVEDDSTLAEYSEKKRVDDHDLRLGRSTPANASLVGNDHQCSAGLLGGLGRIPGEVDRFEIARVGHVAIDISPIQDPVAVQKQTGPRCGACFTAYVAEHE